MGPDWAKSRRKGPTYWIFEAWNFLSGDQHSLKLNFIFQIKTLLVALLANYSYGTSELSFEGALIGLDQDGKVQLGDMVLNEFQFASIAGTQDTGEPGDGTASAGIFGERYRWPNAELPYR